jgi:hypothetical protein
MQDDIATSTVNRNDRCAFHFLCKLFHFAMIKSERTTPLSLVTPNPEQSMKGTEQRPVTERFGFITRKISI